MAEKNSQSSVAQCAPEPRVPLADHDDIGRKVLAQPWAVQSAIVTIAAHCLVIKDKCEERDLDAVSDLAGCISQDLLELANFYAAQPPTAPVERRSSMAAQWTYDPEAEAYYFAPLNAQPGPYYTQRHVDAILDIAFDGTLAGVELIDRVPPPPPPPRAPNSSAETEGLWQLQHSVPSDGFECFYILKNGLQIAEVSGPQNAENTANLQELVNAANAGRPATNDPLADLVARFSAAMLEKLRAAEKKYGWTDAWMQDDWRESCQRQFTEHIQKGDPRDVANYCAFMWHHGWTTKHLPDLPQRGQDK